MNKAVWFSQSQIELMARYVNELTRLHLEYRVKNMVDGWKIEVTGF